MQKSLKSAAKPASELSKLKKFVANLGPGLITGAADDDPSGISTYSATGAAFGFLPLWTALFSFPLMAAVQLMSARLGLVTGQGLATVVKKQYPRWVLWSACGLLLVGNVFNIGADLSGMADATEMLTGINSKFWTPVYALAIIALLFYSSFAQMMRVFKWLTLVLLAYIVTAFLTHPDWRAVLGSTLVPRIEWSSAFLATFMAILGTTISPYLFFWQDSDEVETKSARDKKTGKKPQGASDEELSGARSDVLAGAFFSNLVMYFIILTAAATLHANGKTDIKTAKDAAEALRPLAGEGAYLLYSLGIIGTGMLAIPVLAGSGAYALSETGLWRGSLSDKPRVSPRFYAIIAASVLLGLLMDFMGFDSVKMLFASAVLNGVLAPPLVVLVTLLTSNPKIMGKHVSPPLLRRLGWATAVIMTLAALGMLVTSL